jgi:glycosyltransferase involved in cell wall biosynthesis
VQTTNDTKPSGASPIDPAGLRVCMVSRLFSPAGGLELYCHKVVEGLLERGAHVTVVCEQNQSKLTHPNLKFHTFTAPAKKLSKAERLKRYLELTSNAVKEAGPFDIVHSQHHPVNPVDVATFHNHTVFRLSQVGKTWERLLNNAKVAFTGAYQARNEVDRHLSTTAKCLNFTSKTTRDDFYKTFALGSKPAVISYPGATLATHSDAKAETHTDRNADADQTRKDGDVFTVLFVGKGFRKKGLDILLEAMKTLKSRGKSCRLLIAGLSKKPADAFRLSRLGLDKEVEYLGFRHDMENVYRQADAIVLPSRIEPFGMSPIQGMLRGLVPIVSAVSGVSEILTDNQDALILKNHLDPEELAGLIARLMNDRELTTRLSSAAMTTAKEITWEKAVESTLVAYGQAIGERK